MNIRSQQAGSVESRIFTILNVAMRCSRPSAHPLFFQLHRPAEGGGIAGLKLSSGAGVGIGCCAQHWDLVAGVVGGGMGREGGGRVGQRQDRLSKRLTKFCRS
jgi:hypothetical protein